MYQSIIDQWKDNGSKLLKQGSIPYARTGFLFLAQLGYFWTNDGQGNENYFVSYDQTNPKYEFFGFGPPLNYQFKFVTKHLKILHFNKENKHVIEYDYNSFEPQTSVQFRESIVDSTLFDDFFSPLNITIGTPFDGILIIIKNDSTIIKRIVNCKVFDEAGRTDLKRAVDSLNFTIFWYGDFFEIFDHIMNKFSQKIHFPFDFSEINCYEYKNGLKLVLWNSQGEILRMERDDINSREWYTIEYKSRQSWKDHHFENLAYCPYTEQVIKFI